MSNADDPEWVKGVVAKALLHAADGGLSDKPMSPTPTVPPAAAWPELAPLDTSSFLRPRADEDAAPSQGAEASVAADAAAPPEWPLPAPKDQIVSVVPEQAVPVAATHLTPTGTVSAVTTAQTPQQLTDHSSSLESMSSTPPAEYSEFEAASEHEGLPAVLTDEPASGALETDGPDAVMVEESATTEGFRSSDIRTVLEWLAVIVTALIVALLIKAVVLQAFWIPSESMETTVNKGDRILVNKVSYRLHEVRRGDLVVFEKLEGSPGDTKDLIKRAIALPGETIEIRSDGRIWIWAAGETAADAKLLEEPYLDPQNAILNAPSASDPLSGDVWDERCANQPRTPGRCTLDESSYFMMGDNRNRSSDSRFFGPVPDENIVGRAFLRIWPLGEVGTL